MRGTATLPDGSQKDLLWIRQWDFRWQDRYRYRSPLFLPQGTRLSMRFTFDNSAANPNNRHRSAAARAIGTALDRRDGPALARGRAAPRGGRGGPQRRFRPSLTGWPPSRRPSWTSGSIRTLPPRTMCWRRGICRRDALPTRGRSSKRRCVWIPATRRRTATSGSCCRRRGGSPRGCSTCARPCG